MTPTTNYSFPSNPTVHEYSIVRGVGLDDLEQRVKQHLSNGWTCTGGAFRIEEGVTSLYDVWGQSMFRIQVMTSLLQS